jgi:cytoskeletal protein RodZ
VPQQDHAVPNTLIVRQKKGISIEQIADATKICARYLRAIENGDFGQLPGGIYTTSYIRQYAQAIDYSEEELLEYYYRVSGVNDEPEPDPPKRAPKRLAGLARVLG